FGVLWGLLGSIVAYGSAIGVCLRSLRFDVNDEKKLVVGQHIIHLIEADSMRTIGHLDDSLESHQVALITEDFRRCIPVRYMRLGEGHGKALFALERARCYGAALSQHKTRGKALR